MNIFEGREAALATMHGKEKVISPILSGELGIKVRVPEDFDTDAFGTFTRDIKRVGDQLEAAKKKAKKALQITGYDLAVASEGSFSPDINFPFIQSNLEILVLIDVKNDIEIVGMHKSIKTNTDGTYIRNYQEALDFAKAIGFPEHGMIVRNKKDGGKIYKNIETEEELESIVKKLLKSFFTRKIYLETDMRAHRNPTRMENIREATLDLVTKAKSLCPECGTPGFAIVSSVPGLLCANCGAITDSPKAYIMKCKKCDYTKEVQADNDNKKHTGCAACNP